jgi:uncharacterized protein (DUF983 family)
MSPMAPDRTRPSRTWAILHQRCPACREGRVFRSPWSMYERCPTCNLLFLRETGYFTGAMYFSYALGIPIIALFTLLVYLVSPRWKLWQDILLAWLLFLPLVPSIFRYSRVLWIHLDRYLDPEGDDFPPP